MNLLYNIAIHLYKAGVVAASWRSTKVKEMLEGGRNTLRTLADERLRVAPEGYDVWIHAASLGEFEQGRPMIERLRREHPERKILLTFFSPSGYRVRKNYDQVDTVAYLPLDTPRQVSQFLDAAAPKMAIFVKYEFWGNYLEQLRRRGVPTYIISSIFRAEQPFFKWYGGMFRSMLRAFTHIYVQDEASRKLLANIGVTKVSVAGDTRFDRVTDIQRTVRDVPVVEKFVSGSEFSLVVGSSWEADEDVIFPWINAESKVRVVIAPHEFNDTRLAKMMQRLNGKACRMSQIKSPKDIPAGCRVLIADCFGLLSSIYRYADAAYIGGGFGAGIHNINEAAVYGIPVMFGPKHKKFKEAGDLMACGGGFEVVNYQSFVSCISPLRNNKAHRAAAGKAAGDYIRANLGATDRIYADLF